MAIAYVQKAQNQTGNTNTLDTSSTITTTSGNLLTIICPVRLTSGSDITVRDSASLVWTRIFQNVAPGTSTEYLAVYTATSTGNVGQTFSVDVTGGNGILAIVALEISAQAASPFDTSAKSSDTATTSHTSTATGTLAQLNNLLVGIGSMSDTPDPSPYVASGWDIRAFFGANASGKNHVTATKNVTSNAAVSFDFTTGAADDSVATAVLVFKDAVAGSAGITHYVNMTA